MPRIRKTHKPLSRKVIKTHELLDENPNFVTVKTSIDETTETYKCVEVNEDELTFKLRKIKTTSESEIVNTFHKVLNNRKIPKSIKKIIKTREAAEKKRLKKIKTKNAYLQRLENKKFERFMIRLMKFCELEKNENNMDISNQDIIDISNQDIISPDDCSWVSDDKLLIE